MAAQPGAAEGAASCRKRNTLYIGVVAPIPPPP
jgi:hypothetical protein